MLRFPHGMRPSTLDERNEFYKHEFGVRALSQWIGDRRGTLKFAMIPGRHSGIVAPNHSNDKNNVVLIDDWQNAGDVRAYALDYLPEGLYYDRNRYVDITKCVRCRRRRSACSECGNYDGQQLAFDLDPENVDCPYHGHIGEKMQKDMGRSFCMIEFKSVRRQAIALASDLRGEYEDVGIVFSGRGFHVVVDDESAYALSKNQRKDLASRIGKRFDIDEWVTSGESRLMRLPLSLNALVSRRCVTIKEERDLVGFDPRTSKLVLPAFVRQRPLYARTSCLGSYSSSWKSSRLSWMLSSLEPFLVPPRTEESGLPSYFFLAFFFAFVFFFAPHLPQDMLFFLLFGLLRDQSLLFDASFIQEPSFASVALSSRRIPVSI